MQRLTTPQRGAIRSIEVHAHATEAWFKKQAEIEAGWDKLLQGLKMLVGLEKSTVVNESGKTGAGSFLVRLLG
jgi:hypothetical protein